MTEFLQIRGKLDEGNTALLFQSYVHPDALSVLKTRRPEWGDDIVALKETMSGEISAQLREGSKEQGEVIDLPDVCKALGISCRGCVFHDISGLCRGRGDYWVAFPISAIAEIRWTSGSGQSTITARRVSDLFFEIKGRLSQRAFHALCQP